MTEHDEIPCTRERETFGLSDGRELTYAFHGASSGPAIVVLDGPGSRGMALAGAPAAAELGIRLLAIDRPGFGGSTPAGSRGIAEWPADCLELLDELTIDRVGGSARADGSRRRELRPDLDLHRGDGLRGAAVLKGIGSEREA